MSAVTKFIYLHGFASGPASHKAMAFQKAFAEKKVSLRIPDLEDGDFENLTITGQVERVRKLMDECASARFGLIGSSMGGYLAALLAQLCPPVEALYLMAPGFNLFQRWEERLRREFPAGRPSHIEIFHYRYNATRRLSTRLLSDAERWRAIAFDRKLPIRIIHGIHDATVDIRESRDFARSHPGCRLQELDSDHGLLAHTDWLTRDCLTFFVEAGLLPENG